MFHNSNYNNTYTHTHTITIYAHARARVCVFTHLLFMIFVDGPITNTSK